MGELTTAERRLRFWLIAHAIWSAILALSYLTGGDTASFGYMANSFAKDLLFVALSVVAAADVRRFGGLALVIAAGYVALVIAMIVTLAVGGTPPFEAPLIGEVAAPAAFAVWMGIDIVLVVLFAGLWAASVRARHDLRYLNPLAFVALSALAEVLIEGDEEVVPPDRVARNVDGYLATLQATTKGQIQLALTALCFVPLLTARPPLPVLAPATRKGFLEKRLIGPIVQRRLWRPLRRYVQGAIRTGSQMSYLGYYGDRDSWESIGYTPFERRLGGRGQLANDHRELPLKSLTVPPRERYDTIVVGSGAAGAILARRFAEKGRRVLVVERGPHADPREFTDDEIGQYLRLYNQGALQLATDFNLQVLQGMCVGGGTTINNALCLDPPEPVLVDWEKLGLDRAALWTAIKRVRADLGVAEISDRTTTTAAKRFKQAVEDLRLPGEVEIMQANVSGGCLGTGYCNIGCAYGAKLAGLDMILPQAQAAPHRLDLIADIEVERIDREGDRAVRVRGKHVASGQRVAFEAEEIVIAAGAIGSSWLLQRSGIGGDAVGQELHFNINSPLTAEFPEPVDSFAGIQMSHAYRSPGAVPGYLVETWFNPPATQALAMPGWFGEHFRNMRRYRHMACSGVLVGTTEGGRVKAGRDGPEIEYTTGDADRETMIEGLKVAGRIWFQAGARRVMPATFAWREYFRAGDLDDLARAVREPGDLLMTSAHPQGGNALGAVVDEDFRVRGFKNLYLCDASVFPTSVHVNPQLTVMGLAEYAADRIL